MLKRESAERADGERERKHYATLQVAIETKKR